MKLSIVSVSLAVVCSIIGSRAEAHWQLLSHDQNGDFNIIAHIKDNQQYLPNESDSAYATVAGLPASSSMAQPDLSTRPYLTAPDGSLLMMPDPQLRAAMTAAVNPANQAIAEKVFCYCGCDREHGHKSLLDCYQKGHVPECKTCQREFIRVGQLRTRGETIGQIQNNIDSQFSHIYPYPQPSPTLQHYLSTKQSPDAM